MYQEYVGGLQSSLFTCCLNSINSISNENEFLILLFGVACALLQSICPCSNPTV